MVSNENHLPERKHLRRLPVVFDEIQPLFFVTVTSYKRRRILTQGMLPEIIIGELGNAEHLHGWAVGRYVVMPDHIHFFCTSAESDRALSDFIRAFKRWTTKQVSACGVSGRLWQREFFDHILRGDESYTEKCEYVRLNPIRAGLCEKPDDWKYGGEINNFIVGRSPA